MLKMTNTVNKTFVLDNVKTYFKLGSNSELAEFLKVSRQTISNWYSRNTLDYHLVITRCVDVDFAIDLRWILTGEAEDSIFGWREGRKRHSSKFDCYGFSIDPDFEKNLEYQNKSWKGFDAFREKILDKAKYREQAHKSNELFQLLSAIYDFAEEACLYNQMRELYDLLRKKEVTEEGIMQNIKYLITMDRRFYELAKPYEREIKALNMYVAAEPLPSELPIDEESKD